MLEELLRSLLFTVQTAKGDEKVFQTQRALNLLSQFLEALDTAKQLAGKEEKKEVVKPIIRRRRRNVSKQVHQTAVL